MNKIPHNILASIFERKSESIKKEVLSIYNADKQKCEDISGLWRGIRNRRKKKLNNIGVENVDAIKKN